VEEGGDEFVHLKNEIKHSVQKLEEEGPRPEEIKSERKISDARNWYAHVNGRTASPIFPTPQAPPETLCNRVPEFKRG
jgi:hypothetical protein